MTNEERDIIAKFIARVGGQQQQSSGVWGGSVPNASPALPPVDRDADQFIAQQFQANPEARYRITQMAFVQEAALAEAQNRIKRLEWEVEQTRNAAQQMSQQAQAQPQQSRGILGSLFGGGQQQPQRGNPMAGYQPTTPPPQPQYPPQYQPGMFQRGGGSGFLGTALAGAAGVAGGMMLGNALTGMFSGHGSSAASTVNDASGGLFGGGGGGGFFGGGAGGGSPFDTAGSAPGGETTAGFADVGGGGADPWADGGAQKDFASNSSDGGFWSNNDTSQVSDSSGDSFGDAGGWDSSDQ